MSKYVIDSATLASIGDAVREKDGTTEAILVSNLATRIKAIPQEGGGGGADIPEEAFLVTGQCNYRFNGGVWDWFIELYGDKMTTKDIKTSCNYMFNDSKVKRIPFDLNFITTGSGNEVTMEYTFQDCINLTNIPKINGKVSNTKSIFYGCNSLVELKEEDVEGIDWSYIDTQTTSKTNGSRNNTFSYCYKLRKFPISFLAHGNPVASYSNTIYYNLFQSCFSLDELVGLPVIHRDAAITSSMFSNTVKACYRLKDFIFETNEDGSPIVVNNWSKQTLYLNDIGFFANQTYATNSSYAELTTDKQVIDDATYQALKDDPDWWTTDARYSRYNHDSAVRTINSLPDLSGGAGGNTIIFKQTNGAKTDGGACSDLTAEEIAVATAKGWTVTFYV